MPRIFSLYFNFEFFNFWIFEEFYYWIFCIFELFNFTILVFSLLRKRNREGEAYKSVILL